MVSKHAQETLLKLSEDVLSPPEIEERSTLRSLTGFGAGAYLGDALAKLRTLSVADKAVKLPSTEAGKYLSGIRDPRALLASRIIAPIIGGYLGYKYI